MATGMEPISAGNLRAVVRAILDEIVGGGFEEAYCHATYTRSSTWQVGQIKGLTTDGGYGNCLTVYVQASGTYRVSSSGSNLISVNDGSRQQNIDVSLEVPSGGTIEIQAYGETSYAGTTVVVERTA